MTKPLRIGFMHPDLGIGGAERLIIDAAVALATPESARLPKHDVHMFTSHYDESHCFEETKGGSFPVTVYGDWLPRLCCGGFHIVFATLRAIWLAVCVCLLHDRFDVMVVDQISVGVLVVRMLRPSTRIFFYCHFPDQKLSRKGSWFKSLYRIPFDMLEDWTTGMSDQIVFNSKFTSGVARSTFHTASSREGEILYPCIEVPEDNGGTPPPTATNEHAPIMFLSINRYERKKAIERAVEAIASIQADLTPHQLRRTVLVVAGGYDTRVSENVEYHKELKEIAQRRGLRVEDVADIRSHPAMAGLPGATAKQPAAAEVAAPLVLFVRSFSDEEKTFLLRACLAVLYTPSREHFGIVPIEAMMARRPVVAVNDGGPTESIAHSTTGFLEEGSGAAFGARCLELLRDPAAARGMGDAGRERVDETFSRRVFARHLHGFMARLVDERVIASQARARWTACALWVSMASLCIAVCASTAALTGAAAWATWWAVDPAAASRLVNRLLLPLLG